MLAGPENEGVRVVTWVVFEEHQVHGVCSIAELGSGTGAADKTSNATFFSFYVWNYRGIRIIGLFLWMLSRLVHCDCWVSCASRVRLVLVMLGCVSNNTNGGGNIHSPSMLAALGVNAKCEMRYGRREA